MQQKSPQTILRGGIEGHVLEPFLGLAGSFGLYIGGQAVVCIHLLLDEEPAGAHIGAGIEQRAPRRLTIAACTACFLIPTIAGLSRTFRLKFVLSKARLLRVRSPLLPESRLISFPEDT